jgi:hypothetical protein
MFQSLYPYQERAAGVFWKLNGAYCQSARIGEEKGIPAHGMK